MLEVILNLKVKVIKMKRQARKKILRITKMMMETKLMGSRRIRKREVNRKVEVGA